MHPFNLTLSVYDYYDNSKRPQRDARRVPGHTIFLCSDAYYFLHRSGIHHGHGRQGY